MARIREDPVLGQLVYDSSVDWWHAHVELRSGCLIDFDISADNLGGPQIDTDDLIRRGVEYLAWAREAEPTVREKIADDLLGCHNDNWSSPEEDGLGPMSRSQFLERVTPHGITLNTDGSADWYFDDGNLFAGHWIEVRVQPDRAITEVGLAG